MTVVSSHHGQHENCFACKAKSIQHIRSGPKEHQRKVDQDNPWEGDIVHSRILEIQADAARVQSAVERADQMDKAERAAWESSAGVPSLYDDRLIPPQHIGASIG